MTVPTLETLAPSQARAAPPRRSRRARLRPAHRQGVELASPRSCKRDPGRHLRRQAGARSPAADALRRARHRRGRTASARAARAAAAAASAWSTSTTHPPEEHGREAARLAIAMLDARRRAGRRRWRSCSAPATRGILLHEAVGHGLEADFNRKETSNYSGQLGKRVASELCTVVDDGTLAHDARRHQRRRRGQPGPRRTCSSRTACCVGYMQDRLSAKHFGVEPVGQRAPPELPPRPAAAHDQHRPARRARTIPRRSSARSSAASTPSASPAGRSTSRTATSSSR